MLHETDHKVRSSLPDGCSLHDSNSSSLLSPKFQIDASLCEFERDDNVPSPSFPYGSLCGFERDDNIPSPCTSRRMSILLSFKIECSIDELDTCCVKIFL